MTKIRIYTNESVNVAIAEGLKRRGVDVFTARDSGNLGLADEDQLNYAQKEGAIIFTHDTDFLQIASRRIEDGEGHRGIVYCHQYSYSIGECVKRLRVLAAVLSSEDMINHIEFL